MSDYELVSLFNEHITIVFTVFMGHCSLIFAFLIASFLVAHRLRTSMVAVVILLFTFAIFATTFVQNVSQFKNLQKFRLEISATELACASLPLLLLRIVSVLNQHLRYLILDTCYDSYGAPL